MTRYTSGTKNAPKDEAKVSSYDAVTAAAEKERKDRESRKALLDLFGENREAIARHLYNDARKRVGGRPPWGDLDPDDAYDMGMRNHALSEADALIASMVRSA